MASWYASPGVPLREETNAATCSEQISAMALVDFPPEVAMNSPPVSKLLRRYCTPWNKHSYVDAMARWTIIFRIPNRWWVMLSKECT